LTENVRNNIHEIENIVIHSTIFIKEKQTVRDLSEKLSKEIGGQQKDWIKTNRNMCGFFGSTDKEVPMYSKFRVPNKLVEEANHLYFKIA